MKTKKVTLKDITPKTSAAIKGGVTRFGGGKANDNLTLVRGAKPAKKRDLPPRKTVSGGGRLVNDNITFVRGAKPSKKRDLPPRKDVKGGKKSPT